MSDNATLASNLRAYAMVLPAEGWEITRRLINDAAARIAELEAANIICRRDIEGLMTSCDKLEAENARLTSAFADTKHIGDFERLETRNTELEAELSLDGNARVAAYATERENKCAARIAELEAANAICRTDIEALMRSADSLEARNTELEAEVAWAAARSAALEADYARAEAVAVRIHALTKPAMDRIAELEALSAPDAIQRHYMRGYNAANSKRRSYVTELEAEIARLTARITELEAERDAAHQAARDKAEQYAAERKAHEATRAERDKLKGYLAELLRKLDQCGHATGPVVYQARAALSDPSGE
jgi:chromosome segregation ATPase